MKKIIALFGSLLIIAGVKAQNTPAIKKETTKPAALKPATVKTPVMDSSKTAQKASTIKNSTSTTTFKNAKTVTDESPKETKAIKQTHIKKASPAAASKPMKY